MPFLTSFPQFQTNNPYVAVDAGNLFYAQKSLEFYIDFIKFQMLFPAKTVFNYFTAYNPTKKKQRKFFAWLSKHGYHLVTRKLEYAAHGLKGNVDTEIALHLVTEGMSHNEIVILSGDGDFVPVVTYLRQQNKKVFTLSTKGHMKQSLLKSTYYYDLAWIKDKITQ